MNSQMGGYLMTAWRLAVLVVAVVAVIEISHGVRAIGDLTEAVSANDSAGIQEKLESIHDDLDTIKDALPW